MNDVAIDLLNVSANVLRGAMLRFYPDMTMTDKSIAIEILAGGIRRGSYTLADVMSCAPLMPNKMTTTTVGDGVRDTLAFESRLAPVSAVASRAEASALDALTRLSRALDRIDVLEQDSRTVTDAVLAVDNKVKAIKPTFDAALVSDQVTAAVRNAFKPFEQAVVAAGAQDAVGAMVAVSKVDTVPVSQAFGIAVHDAKGRELTVDLYDDSNAPAVDPCFIWTHEILAHLLLSQSTGENVWFGGEKGTGKSETARQFAARTGRGFVRINFHKYTTSEDYVGAVGLENGQTVFKAGDFLQAFTTPATVILLDEITNADPAALATLNGFLEPNSAVSYGGAVRRRAPNVLVFAADNTLTNGDESGRYAGTRQMNSALADRFARVVAFKHLDIADETAAVMRHTGCTSELAVHVLQAIHACRHKVTTGDIIDAPSIRSVMAFIRAVPVIGVNDAWATAIGNRQPSESAAALEAIKATYISESFILSQI